MRSLKRQLDELHEALASTEDLDEETVESLRRVLGDMQPWLDQAHSDPPAGIRDRLRELAEDFDTEHPVLASSLARIVNALAKMGI